MRTYFGTASAIRRRIRNPWEGVMREGAVGGEVINGVAAPILLGLCAGFASLRHERFAHLLWHDVGCPPAAQEHVNTKGQEHADTGAWTPGYLAPEVEGAPTGALRRVGVLRS